MTLRALAEDVISTEKAEALCPECTEEARRANLTPRPFSSPSELMKLPKARRRLILAKAAEMAEQEYREDVRLTDFEAFGADDIDD